MSFWGRFRRDQRGVSAVLVGICLIAIFGAAMLSVDAGQLWSARRNVVTGTDASALAQARYFALNATGPVASCTSVWSTVLDANAADLTGQQCSVNSSLTGGSGVVIVQAHKTSKARFSGVLGIGGSAAFSMTAVQWGFINQPLGLRPIALCTEDPEVQDGLLLNGITVETHTPLAGGLPNPLWPVNRWAPDSATAPDYAHDPTLFPANYAATPPSERGVIHHIAFAATCGGPGNFGWVDLNSYLDQHTPPIDCGGSCNGNNSGDLGDWLLGGYNDSTITLSPSGNTDCDTQASGVQGCGGDTGAKNANSINCAMNYLMDPDIDPNDNNCASMYNTAVANAHPLIVPIILYDTASTVSSPGGGNNVTFHVTGITNVRIWDYNLSAGNRYLDLEFVNAQFDGVCCSSSSNEGGGLPPAKGTRICGTDHDPQDPSLVAARCTFS